MYTLDAIERGTGRVIPLYQRNRLEILVDAALRFSDTSNDAARDLCYLVEAFVVKDDANALVFSVSVPLVQVSSFTIDGNNTHKIITYPDSYEYTAKLLPTYHDPDFYDVDGCGKPWEDCDCQHGPYPKGPPQPTAYPGHFYDEDGEAYEL